MKAIKFKDFITLQRGFDLPKAKRLEGEFPLVASTKIDGSHNEFKVKAPGVVTGRSGSLGAVQYIDKDFWPLNTTLWVRDFKGNYPRYVYYFLQILNLEQYNSGAGVPTLNRNHLDELELAVHKYEEQVSIANTLEEYERLIDNNSRRITLLEEIAQNLYREWFINFCFPNHEHTQWQETPQGKIPANWEIKSIEECYRTSSGGTPSRKISEYYGDDHDWIKTKELRDSFILETEEKISDLGLAKSSAKLFPRHTTIIAMYGATIGRLGITTDEAATNQACCALLPLEDVYSPWFIYLTLKEKKPEILALGQGAAQQNISQQVIKGFRFLAPEKSLLMLFNERVEPLFLQMENLLKKNNNLKQQRDMLLPKLISG